MRSASPRRRTGAAIASTSLALLFALSGTAFAGEKGQGEDHRKDKTEASADNGHASGPITATEDTDTAATDEASTGQTGNNVVDDGDNLHPSGKDRSVEHGGSGNQGKSQSDPDGMTNGGPDKPGMAGGNDLNDQDGNNGCGNDDDFEDDNNGNCGPKDKDRTPPPVVGGTTEECPAGSTMPAGGTAPKDCTETKTCPEGTTMVAGSTECKAAEKPVTADTVTPGAVLGTQLQNEAPVVLATTATETPATPEARVLGEVIERPATGGTAVLGATVTRGAALARTGFGMTLLAFAGLALVLAGFGLKRAGRSQA